VGGTFLACLKVLVSLKVSGSLTVRQSSPRATFLGPAGGTYYCFLSSHLNFSFLQKSGKKRHVFTWLRKESEKVHSDHSLSSQADRGERAKVTPLRGMISERIQAE